MNFKILIIFLLALGHTYRIFINILTYRSSNNPTPANVSDVYDADTYIKWKKYSAEKCRISIISDIVSLTVTVLLLAFNVHSFVAGLFRGGVFVGLLVVIAFDLVVSTVASVSFSYVDTMVIEEKYGFNRTTMKTFVIDKIRSFIIELILLVGLIYVLMLLHLSMSDLVVVLFAVVIFAVSLAASFLYPFLSRIGNKFTPLEEGELKEKLTALLEKHNYKVKAIEVMDASRRTTKSNAYFSGFGKTKTIVLYDNLVNAMSTEEICAVFAHELGHGIHKDVLKNQMFGFLNMLLMSVLIWVAVRTPEIHVAFGFEQVNYGFAFIIFGAFLSVMQPLISIFTSANSRRAEFRADRQAVSEGYGNALISALKKLSRENFSNLSPSPIVVVLEYSHPALSQRIKAIEISMESAK